MGTDFGLDGAHQVWALRETECDYAPGERFFYSNDGYKLGRPDPRGGRPGAPFTELLEERVLRAARHGRQRPGDHARRRGRRSRCRISASSMTGRATAGSRGWSARGTRRATADGSIVSTASDMCAYARLLLTRGEAPDGRLFSRGELDARLTQRAIDDPDEPGCLVRLRARHARRRRPRRSSGTREAMVGYSSYLMIDPEAGLAVVVLMNGIEERLELVQLRPRGGAGGGGGGTRAPATAARRPHARRRRGATTPGPTGWSRAERWPATRDADGDVTRSASASPPSRPSSSARR